MIELLGYVASFLAVFSFLMKQVKLLRMFNLSACLLFIIYGIFINSIPVVLVNGAIALINIFYLVMKEE